MSKRRLTRRFNRDDSAAAQDDDAAVVRDAEDSLVAALRESDTAAEAIHDANEDEPNTTRKWASFGIAGLALAIAGLVVSRRRR